MALIEYAITSNGEVFSPQMWKLYYTARNKLTHTGWFWTPGSDIVKAETMDKLKATTVETLSDLAPAIRRADEIYAKQSTDVEQKAQAFVTQQFVPSTPEPTTSAPLATPGKKGKGKGKGKRKKSKGLPWWAVLALGGVGAFAIFLVVKSRSNRKQIGGRA